MPQPPLERRKDAEARLFRLLVENVRDYAIFVIDPAGRVRSWNVGAERLLGYREDEIIGQSAELFFTPEDVQAGVPQQEMREALEGGGGNDDRWHVRKDGSRFWSGGMMTPLWDEAHQLHGFAKIMRDRTELKRRVEQERFQQRLLDTVGQAVIATTPDGIILFWNRFAETLYGWSRAEVLGRNVMEVTVPQSRIEDAASVMNQIATGQSWSGEFLVQRRDGTTFPALLTNTPIIDEQGKVIAVVGVSADITARKRVEEDLRNSERQSRTILESITDAFLAVDPDWRVTYVNRHAERIYQMRREDLIGKSFWDVFPDAVGSKFEMPYRTAMAEQMPLRIDGPYGPLGGWLEVDAYPLQNGGLSFYFRDVSERKRAEAEVARLTAESEQQRRIYETALSNTADFNYVFNLRGRFVYINKALLDLWGKQLHEAVGKNFFELDYPPDLADRLQRQIQEVIDTRQPVKDETPYTSAAGERQYEYIFVPVVGANGSVAAVAGSTRDISERKQAEEALRESGQRFRQLADAMPQIVWTARPDGNIDYLNRRWTEFTGLPATAGNDAWRHILHPDDAPRARQQWTASLRSGDPFEMELRLLDRREQIYRWHLIRTVAVKDQAGKVARWFGTSTDIHEQKRAEEFSRYLAEASAALASIVDYESTLQLVANLAVPYFADWSAVDVVNDGTLRRLAVAHQDADKISLAHELTREYPPDPEARSGAGAVLRTGQPEIVPEISDDLLVKGARDERHLRLIRSLGLKSYICVPLVASGTTLGVLTFATAESGRKYTEADLALAVDLAHRAAVAIENTQLYQAIRESDRRKDEFLATLAHELRNPLAPIRNSLQILKLPSVDAETFARSRDMMERQVHHLVRLVDDLLDVSRVMRGKIELRRERIEVATIVARAVETVQPLLDAQGHQFSVRLPNESLPVEADPVRIAQVLGNLLSNAAKYSQPQGHIRLTADRDGDMAVFRIRDTGIGIDPAMLPHIFELFVQADHASPRAQGGLGIGLTLVKNLVEMHNGTVEAHSEGLGKGSEFVVRLPISASSIDRNQGGDAVKPIRQPLAHSGHRLLIVDDNQDAANSLAMLLSLQGHEVRVAYSGAAALEMLKAYAPDVVFLDIGMPGMDGYEVARRLRQQPGLERVVLAALTGWGQQEDRRRTAEAGFHHHFVKPPEPEALESLLAELKRPDVR